MIRWVRYWEDVDRGLLEIWEYLEEQKERLREASAGYQFELLFGKPSAGGLVVIVTGLPLDAVARLADEVSQIKHHLGID